MLNAITVFLPAAPAHVAFLKALSSVPTFHHVHHPTKHSHLISVTQPSPGMQTTQLFFSFYPPDLHSSICHLQNALQQISSWMTANLLTLNSSKTEFLLIGLKQQLVKIQNCPLSTTHSAGNLGFIFDEHISFSDQLQVLLLSHSSTPLYPLL